MTVRCLNTPLVVWSDVFWFFLSERSTHPGKKRVNEFRGRWDLALRADRAMLTRKEKEVDKY